MANTGGRARICNTPPVLPIYACINVFEDAEWLKKCLTSLAGKVAGIIVVDGAYAGFPHEKPWSEDGTVEIAKAIADVTVETMQAWLNEIVKRNQYLKYVPDGAWWLRIDADEELVGDFTEPLQGDCYMLDWQRTDDSDSGCPTYALFRKYPDSEYRGTHHAVWHDGQCIIKGAVPVYKRARLIHHCQERDAARIERKGTYYREVLEPSEREFRKAHGL